MSWRSSPRTRHLCQPRVRRTGGHRPPPDAPEGGAGEQRRVTPRQACPRPNGFGRNLRSKTRWFTGFCNSHQVSHFATFFIDARAEISVAESRFDVLKTTCTRARTVSGAAGARCFVRVPWRSTRRCSFVRPGAGSRDKGTPSPKARRPPTLKPILGSFCCAGSTMILPQVHLRKPCYDFSFL